VAVVVQVVVVEEVKVEVVVVVDALGDDRAHTHRR